MQSRCHARTRVWFMPWDPPWFAWLHDSELASLVFMHLCLSLIMTNSVNHALNRRTLVYTLGGGGGAPAHLRFFLIIFTPSITFFAILPPKWGVTCAWLSCGGKQSTLSCNPCLVPPYPHAGVCRCLCVSCSLARVFFCVTALLCYCVTLG